MQKTEGCVILFNLENGEIEKTVYFTANFGCIFKLARKIMKKNKYDEVEQRMFFIENEIIDYALLIINYEPCDIIEQIYYKGNAMIITFIEKDYYHNYADTYEIFYKSYYFKLAYKSGVLTYLLIDETELLDFGGFVDIIRKKEDYPRISEVEVLSKLDIYLEEKLFKVKTKDEFFEPLIQKYNEYKMLRKKSKNR